MPHDQSLLHERPNSSWWWAALPAILFGLFPLLWFRPGFQLATEDMDLYFDAARWWKYWFIWNPQYNAGTEYSVALAAQGFHAIPAFLNWLGASVITTQKIQWVLWFTFQGLGIAYFIRRILRGRHATAALWVATSFYLFNLYQETVWLGLDIAKISASVTLPCILADYLALLDGSMPLRRAILTITGFSLIGAGVGVNPPLVLVEAGALGVALVAYLVTRQRWRSLHEIRRVLSATIVVGLVVAACHAFWLLPLMTRIGQEMPAGGQSVSASWLDGASVNTSFVNVCRLQGDWTWYQGWKEPYRPYAALYQHHPALLVLSWCLPLLVIVGVVWGRHPHKLFFFLLTTLGLGLSMGSHPPTGRLYQWLVEHVPLFWTLRSPWNKFTLWTVIGYAVFLGLGTRVIHARLAAWTSWWVSQGGRLRLLGPTLALTATTVLVSMNLVYAFPVTLGAMYLPAERRQFLSPAHVRIPEYVWEATRWIDRQTSQPFSRVVVLPEAESWTYTWGLGSASPAPLAMSTTPVLYPVHLWQTPEQPLLRAFYRALYRGSADRLVALLRMLNVKYLVHETDIRYWIPAGDHDDPAFIRAAMARQEGVVRGPTFGAWEWYTAAPDPLPHLYQVPTATLLVGDVSGVLPLTRTELLATPVVVTTTGVPSSMVTRLLAAGAFDSVVISPEEGAAATEIPTTLPVYLVAESDRLTLEVDSAHANALDRWAGFSAARRHQNGTFWRSLESNNSPNWMLENLADHPAALRLEGTVLSPQHARSLYAYLDAQQLVDIIQIPADAETRAAINMTIPPGRHTIGWYSPDARSQFPDGRQVGFEFADDWRVGPPARRGTWHVPKGGRYTVRAFSRVSGQPVPQVAIDNRAIELQGAGSAAEWVGAATLPAGACSVSLRGLGDVPFTMVLTPSGQPSLPSRTLTPVTPHAFSSTRYQWSSPLTRSWLVFSEAYHPAWTLRVRTAAHVPINGFANGYYVESPGPAGASLVFESQRWVVLGGLVSLGALLALGILALAMRKRFP